jgi:uncharacterized protein YukE
MAKTIKINCYELYKNSIYLEKELNKVKEIVEDMKAINEDIKDSWDGIDYDKFYSRFDFYLNSYQDFEDHLDSDINVMKTVAKKHGNIDTDLKDTAKRWENDNYEL